MSIRTYKVSVCFGHGAVGAHGFDLPYKVNVTVRSAAKTRKGVMTAIGRAIAQDYQTDVFQVYAPLFMEGTSRLNPDWHALPFFGHADEFLIWEAAHNFMLG